MSKVRYDPTLTAQRYDEIICLRQLLCDVLNSVDIGIQRYSTSRAVFTRIAKQAKKWGTEGRRTAYDPILHRVADGRLAEHRDMDAMNEPFRVVVADPPWFFNDRLPGRGRGAAKHYKTMATIEICRMPLPNLAADCVLLLWRVASMQQEALDVVRMWGFTVKTELVWIKKTTTGLRWFGMGHTLRAEHEVCLVATRGRPQVKNHSTRTAFVTDIDGFSANTGRHSEKPEKFYEIIEGLFDGPYVELFARRQREGWTCLGDEL